MSNPFKLWRCAAADILYKLAGAEAQKKINADAEQYFKNRPEYKKQKAGLTAVNNLLSEDKTFRSVFYYRVQGLGKICAVGKLFLPPIKAIEIYGEADGGLFLMHNHMVIHTNRAGRNLTVGPGVVMGKNKGRYPTIGDNVTIGANSTVIGDIKIGDNVTILPGTVVTKSLDANAVYGGNPAAPVNG